jgi:hypothetical protein
MWKFSLALLLVGCAARVPSGPGTVDPGSYAVVTPNEVKVIMEVYDDAEGTIIKDFPLSEAVRIDSVSGTISLHRLNGHCKGRDIASVGFLSNGSDNLVTWNVQNEIDAPITATFDGGIPVSSLHFQSFNDLCTPTDFRLALVLHKAR